MMYGNAPFWHDFLDWHVRTEHPWDPGFWVETLSLAFRGAAQQIGEQLTPVFQEMTDRWVALLYETGWRPPTRRRRLLNWLRGTDAAAY
jgi:hypothetical protein